MRKGHNIWQQLADAADLPGEDLPGKSVVELVGDSRVLIERHRGVREYSRECIGINVSCGIVRVSGCALQLTSMTRQQLVIRGRIDAITIQRRG